MPASSYLHYDTVFVILRMPTILTGDRIPESAIAVIKALWSQAAAEAEVERLNQGNRERDRVYFWKATRLERRSLPAPVS